MIGCVMARPIYCVALNVCGSINLRTGDLLRILGVKDWFNFPESINFNFILFLFIINYMQSSSENNKQSRKRR